jgi:hypothetical protein
VPGSAFCSMAEGATRGGGDPYHVPPGSIRCRSGGWSRRFPSVQDRHAIRAAASSRRRAHILTAEVVDVRTVALFGRSETVELDPRTPGPIRRLDVYVALGTAGFACLAAALPPARRRR